MRAQAQSARDGKFGSRSAAERAQPVSGGVRSNPLGGEGGQPANVPPSAAPCVVETKLVATECQHADHYGEIMHAHSMHSALELFIRL